MVDKYVMSDEDYNKLPMNVRKFKKQLKKNNPELFDKKFKPNFIIDPEAFKQEAEEIKIGMRCELN